MEWPEPLVAELAERRCVMFLGSGASAACRSEDGSQPPTWTELLNEALETIGCTELTGVAADLIGKERLLDAAEIIFSYMEAADIRGLLRRRLLTPSYSPSKIHEITLDIDPKILITTNYDKIYDDFCTQGSARDGYSIINYYDSHLLDEIRSSARVVIKAHGCVSNTGRIVLTKSQYFEARANHNGFYQVLDSIFLVNTLLFVGYSVTDPDIQLLLENAQLHFPSQHPHYALVPAGRHEALKESMRRTYNLKLLEYEVHGNDHSDCVQALETLKEGVISYRSTYWQP